MENPKIIFATASILALLGLIPTFSTSDTKPRQKITYTREKNRIPSTIDCSTWVESAW